MAVLSSAKRVLPWACNGRAMAGGSLRTALGTDGGGCSLVPSRWRSSLPQLDPVDRSDEENGGDIDWDNLGFGLTPTDYMYVMRCSQDEGGFSRGELARYGNIELSPSAGVLNYGQGLFEGLKAYRTSDRSGYMLFRPEENARRMQLGAVRMCMPSPSVEQFVHAVKQTVLANRRWEGMSAINLLVEEEIHRAMPGGTGGVKTIGNYAPVLKAQMDAKSKGFADMLYLDSVHKRYVEEASSCNLFVVKGGAIATPATGGTILPGVTRKSIIELARDRGYQVEERLVSIDDLVSADEVFCTGTAVGVTPVSTVTYQGTRYEFRTGEDTLSRKLYKTLTTIQMGHEAPEAFSILMSCQCE